MIAGTLIGCGETNESDLSGVTDVTPPEIVEPVLRANPNNILSYYLEFDTDEPAQPSVSVLDDTGRTYEVRVEQGLKERHELWIVGLRAQRSYTVTVTATDASGNSGTATLTADVGSLPADLPPVALLSPSDPSAVTPGYTIMSVLRIEQAIDPTYGLALAVDEEGEIVWYQRAALSLERAAQLPNGHYGIMGYTHLAELDVMGEVVADYTIQELGLVAMHHDFERLPSGDFVTLSAEMRSIDGYLGGTTTYDVVGDVVVELAPDGTVTHRHSMFDILDPLETSPSFHVGFWDTVFPEATGGTKDWTHGNAVLYDEQDDSILVSLRHLDGVIKIDRETGELIWRLGEGGDFTMSAGGEFFYHQHAPIHSGPDRLMIYDNGNYRPSVPSGEPYFTRVVEYELHFGDDPQQWSVEQIWEYRGQEPYYAPFIGSVQPLDDGHVLICDGGRVADPSLPAMGLNNRRLPRVVEVTKTDPAEVVWELGIGDSVEATDYEYVVHRAQRVTSLDVVTPASGS